MAASVSEANYSTVEFEGLDMSLISSTQIIEFISRNELNLDRLVNEILVADGYRTRMSPFGHDDSVEMLAEGRMGPLGFELPRIAVLVKRNVEPADPNLTELEAFLARSGASNGLFVSWTGFTDGAKEQASRLFHQTKFWDIGQVADMLKENYDALSNDLKVALPLRRIWAVVQ